MIGFDVIGSFLIGHGIGAALIWFVPEKYRWISGWHFRVLRVPYFVYPLVIGIALLVVGLM